jgi:hypothetical protein
VPDYECPDCDFTSTGWPTKKAANARGKQHQTEHTDGDPMAGTSPPPHGQAGSRKTSLTI